MMTAPVLVFSAVLLAAAAPPAVPASRPPPTVAVSYFDNNTGKAEYDPLPRANRERFEIAAVPDCPGELLVADPREGRFRGKRDANLAVEVHLVWTIKHAFAVESKFPLAVERDEAVALKLRTRILG